MMVHSGEQEFHMFSLWSLSLCPYNIPCGHQRPGRSGIYTLSKCNICKRWCWVWYSTRYPVLTYTFLKNKRKPPQNPHFLFCFLSRKAWILLATAFNTEASQAPNIPPQHGPGSAFILAEVCITMLLLSCALKTKKDSRNETVFSISPFKYSPGMLWMQPARAGPTQNGSLSSKFCLLKTASPSCATISLHWHSAPW